MTSENPYPINRPVYTSPFTNLDGVRGNGNSCIRAGEWLCASCTWVRSTEKLSIMGETTKLYTCISRLSPYHRPQETPPSVTLAIAEPVEEIGPAPPSAASQIMISYSDEFSGLKS